MTWTGQSLTSPSIQRPLTYALTAGLRLGGAGSCFTMGETMAGWGIPEVGRPGWAGATMCGENRLETRLQNQRRQMRTERQGLRAAHDCVLQNQALSFRE